MPKFNIPKIPFFNYKLGIPTVAPLATAYSIANYAKTESAANDFDFDISPSKSFPKLSAFSEDDVERILKKYHLTINDLTDEKKIYEHSAFNCISTIEWASNWGDIEALRFFKSKGFKLDYKDARGNTLLMRAGSEEIIKFLVEEVGIDPKAKNIGGMNALMYNSSLGHFESIKALQSYGLDVNEVDNNGKTALMHAADLSERGVSHRDLDHWEQSIEKLLSLGAKIDIQDQKGKTALMYANEDKTQKILIEAGANLNLQDNEGKTALMHEAQKMRFYDLKGLIEAGSDLNLQDKEGKTALMHAVLKNQNHNLKALIEAGADLNLQDNEGKTALIHAAQSDKNPFDADTFFSQGGYEARHAYDIISTLTEAGADAKIEDNEGYTAVEYAKKKSATSQFLKRLGKNKASMYDSGDDKIGQSIDDWRTSAQANGLSLKGDIDKIKRIIGFGADDTVPAAGGAGRSHYDTTPAQKAIRAAAEKTTTEHTDTSTHAFGSPKNSRKGSSAGEGR